MTKTKTKVDTTPGVEQPQQNGQLPTQEQIADWSEKDLRAAVSFITLLLEDKEAFQKLVHTIYQNLIKVEQMRQKEQEFEKANK